MKIAVVQYNISWKNKSENFIKIREMLNGVDAELIVLPEMFQTGFCIDDASVAEDISGDTMQFLHDLSIEKSCCITGSFMCKVENEIVNRFVAVNKGEIKFYYDKIHLFKLGEEDKHISAGDGVADFVLNGIKIRPLICYDLRFPYASYNTSDYDILLYVANWPSKRISHWDQLLAARAVENQSFVIACNRVGEQDGFFYPGHSSVLTPTGEVIASSHKETVLEVEIDLDSVKLTRAKLPFLKDQIRL